MSEPDGGTRITFTVKELLAEVNKKLDSISGKLDAKADHAHVIALELRLNDLAQKVALQEKVQEATSRMFTRNQKVLLALVAVAALMLQAYVVFGGVG